jgi:hypothetical protein
MEHNSQPANNERNYSLLWEVPDGSYPCRKQFWQFWRHGWLHFETKHGLKQVSWTPTAHFDSRKSGGAFMVEVRSDGQLQSHHKQVFNMWPEWIRYTKDTDPDSRMAAFRAANRLTDMVKAMQRDKFSRLAQACSLPNHQ